MYSKNIYLKEEAVEQPIKDNSPVSEDLVIQIKEIYDLTSYNTATEYLFGNRHMAVTDLTIFQAEMLIIHAETLRVVTIPEPKKKRGSINVKPYRNIWNTLEKRTR